MRVLVINLDRSPERLAEFSAEAARCGLAFERLPAVDGRALRGGGTRGADRPRISASSRSGRGEVAIFLSHRAGLAHRGGGRTRPLDGDHGRRRAAGRRRLPALLAAIEEIDPDAGIVRLETTLRRVVLDDEAIALTPGRSLHRMRSWHGGTAAYAIHHNCAADLLARSERISDPLDQWLFNPLSPIFGTLAIGQVVPGAAVQAALLDERRRAPRRPRPAAARRRRAGLHPGTAWRSIPAGWR